MSNCDATVFILIYYILFCHFFKLRTAYSFQMKDRKGMYLVWRWGGEELGGIEEWTTVIRMYHIKKYPI